MDPSKKWSDSFMANDYLRETSGMRKNKRIDFSIEIKIQNGYYGYIHKYSDQSGKKKKIIRIFNCGKLTVVTAEKKVHFLCEFCLVEFTLKTHFK